MWNRRITKSVFRPCSTCLSRSQAPFCLYTLRTIADRAEGTFESLRYSLGGDRPSQTAHLALFPRLHTAGLELKYIKAGISPMTPHAPKSALRSLPAILRMMHPNPMLSYSKGA
jgi:hypothetical protein